MSFLLGIAGALASLYVMFYAFSRAGTDGALNFLGFAGLFLFLLFAWGVGQDFQEQRISKRKGKK